MNLFRSLKGAPLNETFKFILTNKTYRPFVALATKGIKRLDDLKTPKEYYEELLKEVPVSEKGLMTVDAIHLTKMLNRCKTTEDLQLTIDAYYNFVGHRTFFENRVMDSMVNKAVQLKSPQLVHDIIVNHNYLMYYPHPDVLVNIMKFYRTEKLTKEALGFAQRLRNRKLLKIPTEFYEEAIAIGAENNDPTLTLTVYKTCTKNDIKLSPATLRHVIQANNAYQKLENKGEAVINVQSKIATWAEEQSKSLTPAEIVSLSDSQPNPAAAVKLFALFQDVNLEEIQKSGKVLFETTDANKAFFENLYKKIGKSPTLYLQYSKVLKELKRKLPKTVLSKELLEFVTESNRTTNESFKARGKGKGAKSKEGETVKEGNKEVEAEKTETEKPKEEAKEESKA